MNREIARLNTTVQAAMDDSIREDRIVHLAWTPELGAVLSALADDSARNGTMAEFWGKDSDGDKWRIHLDDVA